MTSLTIITRIKAPSKIVFDVSRNIDIHQLSVAHTNEKAIAGTTSGLIGLNETVTFRGKHFGIYLTHESQITAMESPDYFTDEMIKGHFSFFRHEHIFEIQEDATIMTDKIQYKVPFGSIGKLFDFFILKRYLRAMIRKRNELLKYIAEN